MNIQSRHPTTADEFLRWNEGREGKREFVQGRVVEMMVGVSESHWWIVSRLQLIIARQIGLKDFIVGASDFGARTPDGVRYPDLLVVRPSGQPRNLAAKEPLFIAEVLSPSSLARDLVEKQEDYRGLPSLREYLVLSQEEARVWLWSRDRDQWTGPTEISGMEGTVELQGLEVTIELSELYEGIGR
ncbi:Uma2 family endonuclease [Mesorhizobium sp. CN2-181]|uniref:Uma2 family endonuclease n=1 Tax=Mesorhizobium yinganensis TaxID=3157707 RepID=UPI0032B7B722